MLVSSTKPSVRMLIVAALACFICGCGGSSRDSSANADGNAVEGNPVHGKELYQQCAACHKMQENSMGPMHCNLFGRSAGSVPGFEYSQAMRDSGIVWGAQQLDEFLAAPISYVSGTKMGFAGFSSASDRHDVIAYLQEANRDPSVCPGG